jgi:ABC-type polar amino acid transport system ATPase subunit
MTSIERSPLLAVHDLTKIYRLGGEKGNSADSAEMEVRALRGVSLDVMPAEFVALTGPSGSGKSTFMHLLGCLDRPTSGDYFLSGQNVSLLDKRVLARVRNREIGFVFQGFNLLPRTSALENVELPLLYGGVRTAKERRDRAAAALHAVGLGQRIGHHPNQLSGGQQQRVAIARALAMEPALMLFDEPTSALDPETIGEVLSVMKALADEGMTMLVVTHEMDFARRVADRVVVFDSGHVIEQGSPKQIFENAGVQRTREFLSHLGWHGESIVEAVGNPKEHL